MTVDQGERLDREELVDLGGSPVMLNLGCGDDGRGVGIDLHYEQAEIQTDLDEGVPIATAAVDEVLAEHVLEHLENPAAFLREVRRVLRDDGEAVFEVPNGGWLPVRLYVTQDVHRFWEHKIPGRTGHWLARRLGDPSPERTPHLSLWTKRLLRFHLERAGFAYEWLGWTPHVTRNLRVRAWPTDDSRP